MFAAVLLQGLTCLRIHLASMYPLLVVMCLCPHPIKTQYHTTNIKIVLHKINSLLLLFSNILFFNSLKMRKNRISYSFCKLYILLRYIIFPYVLFLYLLLGITQNFIDGP